MKAKHVQLTAFAAAVTSLAGAARADESASPLSFNVGAVTDYRYRGISQSRLKPALQGGADYAASNGIYVGTWMSTISWIRDAGIVAGADAGKSPIELDLYVGHKGDLVKDSLTYDVGGLLYYYAGNKFREIGAVNAHTFEIYGALTYGVATVKYSRALTNLFGFGAAGYDSKGSGYLDLSANVDLGGGYTLTPHVGHQQVAKLSSASYTDYSLALSKDMGDGFLLSATVQSTNAKKLAGAYVYSSPEGKNLGKSTVVFGAKYSF